MKQFLKKIQTEDWVVVAASTIILALTLICPQWMPQMPALLVKGEDFIKAGLMFLFVAAITVICQCLLGRKKPFRVVLPLVAVFVISLLAQVVSQIGIVKEYGFEAVFFSVIFGLLIRNVWHVPDWMKPAIQGELYIKIGVVCLGATILFNDVMKSGMYGLLQACIVILCVWFTAYFISRRFGVDQSTAMILSSGVSICGVSACITASKVAGGDDRKLSYIISLVLIIVVPMIYLMPWLARTILPLFFDDAQTVNEIAGAWIGGTIDTTSGVAASSEMLGDVAQSNAVIIKATQNVLIGVVAFFIALYMSAQTGDGKRRMPSPAIVWEKFPKFIIGFVLASLVFSLFQINDLFVLNGSETKIAKTMSTVFFSLAFVCIGLDTRLKDIISKENRRPLWAFLLAQTFNIVFTFVIAVVLFGLLKN